MSEEEKIDWEKRFRYEFNLRQMNLLAKMLNRVELRGSEVPVFNQIIESLNKPIKVESSSVIRQFSTNGKTPKKNHMESK